MEVSKPEGFYQIVKSYFEDFWTRINISSRDIITYVSCFGAGFLLGVIIKRYGKWIVTIVVASILVLLILDYFEFITIHQEKVKAFLVLYNIQDFDSVMIKMKEYAIELGIILLGILLGFKLG
ncbi:MAG: FUN14 domain-containing protein [Candidatus Babeliales bacterium]